MTAFPVLEENMRSIMIIEKALFGEQTPETAQRRREVIKVIKKKKQKATESYLRYGRDYFDNPDIIEGYRKYRYDGRYEPYAENIIKEFNLSKGAHILEIGCAKGFILKEFQDKGMHVYGVDVSKYAVEKCHPDVREKVTLASGESLDFKDQSIDFLICKDVLSHISFDSIDKALSEINRVTRGTVYLEIPCGKTGIELENLRLWDPTYQIINTPEWWKKLIGKYKFNSIVYFKILIPEL